MESLSEVFEWAGPQSEARVATLERSVGAALPPSYRAFLRRYGAGGIRALTGISGIYDEPLSMELGTAHGDTARARTDHAMPNHLIVIERGDEHFPPMCLDTARPGPDGEYPVVGFWLLSRTISTDSYANFAEYLERSLADNLELLRDEQV